MVYYLKHIAFLLACFLIYSCSTDFELNAPRDESPVIFGLLDASQDTQIVKITKTFLGDGDLEDMAAVRDSFEYEQKLDAFIIRQDNQDTIFLDTLTLFNKEEGVFFNEANTYYYTTENISAETRYELVVKAPNKTARASTVTVSPVNLISPRITSLHSLVSGNSAPWRFRERTVEWKASENLKFAEASMLFYYEEHYTDGSKQLKIYEYFIGSKKFTSIAGGETASITWNAENFFKALGRDLTNPANLVKRTFYEFNANFSTIRYKLTLVGEELYTYLILEEPSTGIVQERPKYSNVSNGLGIFSSRFSQVTESMSLNTATKEALLPNGVSYTQHLKFSLD